MKRKVLLLLSAVLCAVFIAAAAAGCSMLGFSNVNSDGDLLFFIKDDAAYMAVGREIVELEGAIITKDDTASINGMIDTGMNYLYYLADTKNGEGDLMRISLSNPEEGAEKCAKDVCCAKVSADGESVLFLRDIDGNTGDLYLWKDGKEEEIDNDVVDSLFGISPKGKAIFYFTADWSGENAYKGWLEIKKTLYFKEEKSEPEKVDSVKENKSLRNIYIFDDGTIIYTLENYGAEDQRFVTYRYSKGDTEDLHDGYSLAVFNSSELIMLDETSLYYRSANGDTEKLTKDFGYILMQDPELWLGIYMIVDTSRLPQKHFIIVEADKGDRNLFECVPGKTMEEILKSDIWSFQDYWFYNKVSSDFNWLAYIENDELKLAHKQGGEWEDDIDITDDARSYDFDAKSKNLYYVTTDDELWKYELNKEDDDRLLKNVISFEFWGEDVLAETRDGELYIITEDDDSKIADDVYRTVNTPDGGLLVATGTEGYELYYLESAKADDERIEKDIERVFRLQFANAISYYPDAAEEIAAEPEEDTAALEVPAEEAAAAQAAAEPAEEAVEESKYGLRDNTLIVCLDGSFPPMEYFDENGELTGFDIDFAVALAEEMGVEIEFINVAWDQIFLVMYSGECDAIISSVSVTNDRLEAMHFSIPYFRNGAAILSTPDIAEKIETENDLEGLKVGVCIGTISDIAAQNLNDTVDFELLQYSDYSTCLTALAGGEVDCISINMMLAINIISDNPDAYSISSLQLTNTPIAIAMNQNTLELEAAINEAITSLRESGRLAELSWEYFGADYTSDIDTELK